MRAVVFSDWQTFPTIENVDQPEPGPGEVLLKVAGAGACHSDVAIYKDFAKDAPGSIPPPFTLGHENAGWVEELGPGVARARRGRRLPGLRPDRLRSLPDVLAGSGHLLRERCRRCPTSGVGLGRDGGMAEYVAVPPGTWCPSATPTRSRRRRSADAGPDPVPRHQERAAEPRRRRPVRAGDRAGRPRSDRGADPHRADRRDGDRDGHEAGRHEAGRGERGRHGPRRRRPGRGRSERSPAGRGVDAAFDFVGVDADHQDGPGVDGPGRSPHRRGHRRRRRGVELLLHAVRVDDHQHLLGHDRGPPQRRRHVPRRADPARDRAVRHGRRPRGVPAAGSRRTLGRAVVTPNI